MFVSATDWLFPLLLLVLICVSSWLFVLRPSIREKYPLLTWRFQRRTKKQTEGDKALSLAIYLLSALVSTTVLIAILIGAVTKFVNR